MDWTVSSDSWCWFYHRKPGKKLMILQPQTLRPVYSKVNHVSTELRLIFTRKYLTFIGQPAALFELHKGTGGFVKRSRENPCQKTVFKLFPLHLIWQALDFVCHAAACGRFCTMLLSAEGRCFAWGWGPRSTDGPDQPKKATKESSAFKFEVPWYLTLKIYWQ